MTRQPNDRSSLTLRASRATLPENFRSQKSLLVFGVEAFRHPGCRCQKQPCTNTTARLAGSTISGLPGRSLWRSEKRNPRRCSNDRTRFSGAVSRPRMRLMLQLRCSGVMRSMASRRKGKQLTLASGFEFAMARPNLILSTCEASIRAGLGTRESLPARHQHSGVQELRLTGDRS